MTDITPEDIEQKAREIATIHGGKMAYSKPGEGMFTNAYVEMTRAGLWSWGRGLHTPDLLATYADHRWRTFIDVARAALGQSTT